MAECKACSAFFGSAIKCDLCPTCERAVNRLKGYAVPVVHARWIPAYRQEKFIYSCDDIEYFNVPNGFTCSQCGHWELNKEPYCNCGAKMDGDKE